MGSKRCDFEYLISSHDLLNHAESLGTQNGKAGNYKVKIGENAQENEE